MLSNCTKRMYNSGNKLILYQELCKHIKNTSHRNLFENSQFTGREKVYNGRKLVGFSMEQMFSVVSDVGNYNKFVPFCKTSLVLQQTPEFMKVYLEIGFPPLVESYTSHVTLVQPRMVKSECKDGKLFDHLLTIWKFSPALKNNLQSCIIDFYVSFEFRSAIHSGLAHIFFDTLVRQMELAFITEARARYGKESVPSQQLEIINSRS